MITRDKLAEYIWASGDIDGWCRSGRQSDIADDDWRKIDILLSAITVIRHGLAAECFKQDHYQMVRENVNCDETYKDLVAYEKKCERN
jgi:hypothetical protein